MANSLQMANQMKMCGCASRVPQSHQITQHVAKYMSIYAAPWTFTIKVVICMLSYDHCVMLFVWQGTMISQNHVRVQPVCIQHEYDGK